ncbi:NAD(P)-dependent malic enzyme [Cyclobacterium qasimii]|uniref:NADP-dependent malic enzyme n=2 Tax=Cyclobacterium qasimii TaxID=1350429 RepID=S7VMG8_9BACT|nr:NADP-dependent malic enzyme [Cyclobacterium qasimii]EPR71136.1 NADP-dependent malic enzyme [Cyclobacterium qasimii M12-11B]GEO20664.1 malate dehydrogenase [Cyclobacterium qasimii]
MPDYYKKSIELHQKLRGKIEISNKVNVASKEDLAVVYSPGVAQPCLEIEKNQELAYDYTIKGNTVAVISDGSAVLGLGNIGPKAAIPVMEGKAMLFKKFGGVDAFPICLDTQNSQEIIDTVKRIAPVFGGVNLEDISAPRCFEIEAALQEIGIPVFHDDQHGTAIVTLAGILNACKVLGKNIDELKVVVNGAGSAGVAISKLLRCVSMDPIKCQSVKEIIICDSKGIIHRNRTNLNPVKQELLEYSNPHNLEGSLQDALKNADVFIGVSKGNILSAEDVKTMNENPVIFALANPEPEITPEEAYKGGAAIVATGRSDYPNQVNNVLVFPGIFRGALDGRAKRITPLMKLAAAYALANCIDQPTRDRIIPSAFDDGIANKVSNAVANSCSTISNHNHNRI